MIYPWQQLQWNSFLTRKKNATLPHAVLLTGASGLGKSEFACELAKYLLCINSADFSCGQCSACELIHANNHPDLFIIRPEECGKTIKIEQIRNLIAELNNTSQQGGYQVAIIEPADAMNIAAANALLKTLEEPNEHVLLILVSANETLLPATVRSRCQKIIFKAPEKTSAKKWLSTQIGVAHDLDLLLSIAENSPLKALALVKSDEIKLRAELFNAFIDFVTKKISVLKFAEYCATLETAISIKYLLSGIADLIKLKHGASMITNFDLQDELIVAASKLTLENLQTYYAKIVELSSFLTQKLNLNKQMLFENIFLSWEGNSKHVN